MATTSAFGLPEAVLLVGGGRNARNLVCVLATAGISVLAIVDDAPTKEILGHKVGYIDDVDGAAFDALLTIADPELAEFIRQRPALQGCRWPPIIHPTSVVSSYAQIGEGCYVGPFAVLTDVLLGSHVHLFAHNVLGARVSIGDFTVVLPHATVASDVRIGKRCMIGMGARIHAGVNIGDNCRVGVNAIVRRDMQDCSIAICERSATVRGRVTLGKDRRRGLSKES